MDIGTNGRASWRARIQRSAGRTPAVATPPVLSLTTGAFYILGGGIVGVAAPMVSLPGHRAAVLGALGLLAVLIGLLVLRLGTRTPRWAYHPLLGTGTLLVTAVVLIAGGGPTAVALSAPYLLVIVDASFFFSVRGMVAHLVLAQVSSAAALTAVDVGLGEILCVQGCALVVGLSVAALARAADAAEVDALTGLVNRRGLDRQLEECLLRAARGSGQLALVLLDLDCFKQINDERGHQAGDRMLADLAALWRRHLPAEVTLTRYGGDEFALLTPGCSLGRAADLADELRALTPTGVSVSAGVASWEFGDSASTLLRRADVALYDAKTAGRDMTVVYGDPSRGASELEAAIANGEMVLHFQPVVNLSDATVVGYESLVRWQHPRKGLVGPATFVPQAERTGAIHALGAWTLERACAMATAIPEGSVAVNVSVRELRSPDYPGLVCDAVRRHDVRHGALIVEITEAAFDDGDPQVAASLAAIREVGVLIALDDFGSGYSSLRRLSEESVDIVKIDGSFVRAMTEDRLHFPVLEAIIGLGHALGLRVVAECVETPHQAAVLRALGCELAQGYLFGRPAPQVLGRESAATPVR